MKRGGLANQWGSFIFPRGGLRGCLRGGQRDGGSQGPRGVVRVRVNLGGSEI